MMQINNRKKKIQVFNYTQKPMSANSPYFCTIGGAKFLATSD